jgi:hypothetical protein
MRGVGCALPKAAAVVASMLRQVGDEATVDMIILLG